MNGCEEYVVGMVQRMVQRLVREMDFFRQIYSLFIYASKFFFSIDQHFKASTRNF